MSWLSYYALVILLSFGGELGRSAENDSSFYRWTCVQQSKCVRKHIDNIETFKEISYQSQSACRATCGRYGALWPRPTGATLLGQQLIAFNPNEIRFDLNNVPVNTKDYIKEISRIFQKTIKTECGLECAPETNAQLLIRFYVRSSYTNLTWTTDESYSVDVSTENTEVNIQITAQTIFGARHGLETLSQLIVPEEDETNPNKNCLLLVATARIKDRPIFPHRGLMIDTARNFIPIIDLERTIDGMGASKLNVFHWHATDSQSFPLEMPSVPFLTRYGAYSPQHIYQPHDVRHLIEYARHRGVRVIIEIDAPSHAGNGWQWGPRYGLGDLAVCVNQQPWRQYCIQPPCGQLNPANQNLFRVLKDVYRDLTDMIPEGETLHMGGDEVHFGCWNSTKQITDLLRSRGRGREVEDFLQLWAEYQAASLSVWDQESGQSPSDRDDQKPPNKVIVWSSHLTDFKHIEKYLQKDRYIIQTWVESSDELPTQLLAKGYNLIMSTKNAWYFDHGFWGRTTYYQWRTVYQNRIPLKKGVLGGEACVWTELIDGESLDARIWPRAAAVAERLWSDPSTDSQLATTRFYRHNDRLRRTIGIQSEPIAPKYCIQNEGECY